MKNGQEKNVAAGIEVSAIGQNNDKLNAGFKHQAVTHLVLIYLTWSCLNLKIAIANIGWTKIAIANIGWPKIVMVCIKTLIFNKCPFYQMR